MRDGDAAADARRTEALALQQGFVDLAARGGRSRAAAVKRVPAVPVSLFLAFSDGITASGQSDHRVPSFFLVCDPIRSSRPKRLLLHHMCQLAGRRTDTRGWHTNSPTNPLPMMFPSRTSSRDPVRTKRLPAQTAGCLPSAIRTLHSASRRHLAMWSVLSAARSPLHPRASQRGAEPRISALALSNAQAIEI